jgi:hypothetical protein
MNQNTICQCKSCVSTRLGISRQCDLKINENQPENLWISFKHDGTISSSTTIEPTNINFDVYGRKWIKLSIPKS